MKMATQGGHEPTPITDTESTLRQWPDPVPLDRGHAARQRRSMACARAGKRTHKACGGNTLYDMCRPGLSEGEDPGKNTTAAQPAPRASGYGVANRQEDLPGITICG